MPATSCFVPCFVDAALSLQIEHLIMRSSLYGFSGAAWRCLMGSGARTTKLDFVQTRFHVRRFSALRLCASRGPTVNRQSSMKEESDSFYVVRKGDIIGIYKSLCECQAQVSSSVCDPSVSVYKGFSLLKETEEYFTAQGLKNALYSIRAVDMQEDLFGTLVPCSFQQPDYLAFVVDKSPKKTSIHYRPMEMTNNTMTCIIEYNGACKGNPGNSGAGAVLRTEDGNVIHRVRQGLGVVTNHVAEYRALILAMEFALKKGFKQIRVQGDSMLVCMQVNGLWRTKKQTMADLCEEVEGLKKNFTSFKISHVMREFNSDADAQANLAVCLPVGQVYEDCGEL